MERTRRLRKGTEFDTAYSKGTVVGSPLLAVRYVPNGLDVTRWGFAVGKRLAKRAVVRNRTKRRIREIARGLDVANGFDVIVVARAPALVAGHAALVEGLTAALVRAGVTGRQP